MKMGRIFAALLAVAGICVAAQGADYKVDPIHSMIVYRIKHLQSSYSYGRFDAPEGTFTYDEAAPEKSSFSLTVEVDNVDTGNKQRDGHLKSPDFFNAKEFPNITFKSTSIKKTGDNTFDVVGDLTIHGVTKSMTLPVTLVGTCKGMAGETRTGFESVVEFKRSDFGMKSMLQAAGDDVRLLVTIEGIQQ